MEAREGNVDTRSEEREFGSLGIVGLDLKAAILSASLRQVRPSPPLYWHSSVSVTRRNNTVTRVTSLLHIARNRHR